VEAEVTGPREFTWPRADANLRRVCCGARRARPPGVVRVTVRRLRGGDRGELAVRFSPSS